MKKLFIPISLLFILSGCATTHTQQRKTVVLKETFDAKEISEKLQQTGRNTIKGSALLRQQGGGVVTCAGGEVSIIPATKYSTERVTAIYNSTESGFNNIYAQQVNFEPTNNEYIKLFRITRCDAQGYFSFNNVKDGDYYVVTTITWNAGNMATGGTMIKKVSVSGGKTTEIVLSP